MQLAAVPARAQRGLCARLREPGFGLGRWAGFWVLGRVEGSPSGLEGGGFAGPGSRAGRESQGGESQRIWAS